MDRSQLTTQAINVVIALADEGSFTAAAARLGITQSAVSRALRQLEDSLGAPLFTRSRTGATPTAALLSVLPQLRTIRRELDRATEALSSTDRRLSGSVRVAGFRSAVTVLLPPAVSAFMADHGDVRVSLLTVREQAGGVQQFIEDGQADFGVTSFKPPARLRSMYLGSDPYVLVRRREKTRTSRGSQEQLILWNERCSEPVPRILEHQGWNVRTRMEVDSDTGVLAMVAQGTGFTIMPEIATEPLSDELEKLPLQGGFKRDIWLCGRPSTWESKSATVLATYIKKAVRRRLARET